MLLPVHFQVQGPSLRPLLILANKKKSSSSAKVYHRVNFIMKQFLVILLIGLVHGSPVVVEPIVPGPIVPVVPVQDSIVVPIEPKEAPAVAEPVKVAEPVVAPAVVEPVVVPLAEKKEEAVVPVVEVKEVKEEVIVPVKVAAAEPVVPAVEDPQLLLSEPIDKATKMIIDLDEHLRKYLPAEDEVATTLSSVNYAGEVLPALIDLPAEPTFAERQNQMTALIDQVNRLAESIENTITDLVARRRYVTAAMLRSMLNYVRRVRVNLERLQNRLQSVQAVASVGQNQNAPPSPAPGVPGAAFFNTIRDRINRITEEIGALVSRIRGSFTPGGPTSAPLPPLATSSPLVNNAALSAAVDAIVGVGGQSA